jgi:coatomer protein complex subunit alpha (xenin)
LNLDSRGFGVDESQPQTFITTKDIEEPIEGNWGVDDILDVPEIEVPSAGVAQDTFKDIADSAPGKDPSVEKTKNSQIAGELVAIGEFEEAARLLKKQIGVVEVQPLLPIFDKIYKSSKVMVPGLPFTNPVSIQLSEDGKRPYVLGNIGQLSGLLKVAYRYTTEGKFAEALQGFQNVLLHIPLLVLKKQQEEEDVYALIRICYHYILAMKCELAKKQNAVGPYFLSIN